MRASTTLPYFLLGLELHYVIYKPVGRDSIPNLSEGVKIKVEIMMRVQDRRKNLVCQEQMPQISAAIVPANPACTGLIHRPRIASEPRILDDNMA